jgi:hypothetical protein
MQCTTSAFSDRGSIHTTYKKALAMTKPKSHRTSKSKTRKSRVGRPGSIMSHVVKVEEFPYSSHVYTAETGNGRKYFVKAEALRKLGDKLEAGAIPDEFFGDYTPGCKINSSNFLFKEIIVDCDVQRHVSSHIAKLHEWGTLNKHQFTKYGLTSTTPVIYAMYDMVPGQTLHHALLKTSTWPFQSATEFIDQFARFLNMLVYLARKADFRHNDLWTKNMYIVDNPKTGKPEFYLIDLGWATNSLIRFGSCAYESRYQKRVHTIDQIRGFFFNKLPADHSDSVFSYHKGRIYELDMINLLNCYLTVMYLKYPEHVAWLERTLKHWLHASTTWLNNRKVPYHTRLEALAKRMAAKP